MRPSKLARAELMAVVKEGPEAEDWATASGRYRQLLYVSGEVQGVRENGQPVKKGFTAEAVEAVIEKKGEFQ